MVFIVPIFMIFPPIPVETGDALRQTHRKLGRTTHRSRLPSRPTPEQEPQQAKIPHIKSLFIYPIKSCRGVELDRSKVLPSGLEHDRLFTFAQLKPVAGQSDRWECLTQRQLPLLANVKVDVWLPDPFKKSRQLGHSDARFLVVRFPWQAPGWRGTMHFLTAKLSRGLSASPEKQFILPLDFPSQEEIKARTYDFSHVKIWEDVVQVLNMSAELPPQLAMYLGAKHQLALFRSDPSSRRQVFRNIAAPEDTLGHESVVDFQDGVFSKTLTPVWVELLVSGLPEYDEDDWKSVRFRRSGMPEESSVFTVTCRTVRCKLPNVDPATGVRHSVEPDRSLRKYRQIDDGAPRMGCLGMQLCPVFPNTDTPEQLESYVEAGMDVEVLKRGPHRHPG
ncbi:hypothetical protein E4U33_005170 [Claviceps sp. LM78 group G4]|nr:hypothetical protein E4U33_005170 [Claviceps sp. LM78 group G4]